MNVVRWLWTLVLVAAACVPLWLLSRTRERAAHSHELALYDPSGRVRVLLDTHSAYGGSGHIALLSKDATRSLELEQGGGGATITTRYPMEEPAGLLHVGGDWAKVSAFSRDKRSSAEMPATPQFGMVVDLEAMGWIVSLQRDREEGHISMVRGANRASFSLYDEDPIEREKTRARIEIEKQGSVDIKGGVLTPDVTPGPK